MYILLAWEPSFAWNFPTKSQPSQIRIFKPGLEHSRRSLLSSPTKIRPGVHELWSNIKNKQTYRQADTTSLYIIFVQYAIHCNTTALVGKVNLLNLETKRGIFSWFYRVPRSVFQTNQSRYKQTCKQTYKQKLLYYKTYI